MRTKNEVNDGKIGHEIIVYEWIYGCRIFLCFALSSSRLLFVLRIEQLYAVLWLCFEFGRFSRFCGAMVIIEILFLEAQCFFCAMRITMLLDNDTLIDNNNWQFTLWKIEERAATGMRSFLRNRASFLVWRYKSTNSNQTKRRSNRPM